MAQKTNFNVSPYFDDFSQSKDGAKDKNYYKILFSPGKPIQARELNTLQSILQDQLESFGSHIFKEGSLVIPGNITFDNQFSAVKLNPLQYGIDLSAYLSKFIGKKVTGQTSGVTAKVQYLQLPNSEVEFPTIYVKYGDSDANFESNSFTDGEELSADKDIVYGNTTIPAGTPFATLITADATATGSSAYINEGVYFIRGAFVRVKKQTIILDYYTNTPSYRVGLRVNEQIITAEDDPFLYDNAKGFTNYAAPGADRFKISLDLTKKPITDLNDTDFIELLRVDNGTIKKIEVKSQYSIIRDYLAERTYDESGNYVVDPFKVTVHNSLNNRLGNDGLYYSDQKTDKGDTPSDDLMCVKVTPGKAYVKGYDINTGIEILDVPKPRSVQTIESANIPFEMGNLIRVNNVSGTPKQKAVVYIQNQRKDGTAVGAGETIGSGRIYNFNVTDAAYTGATTSWDLYLYDLQIYTLITLNKEISSTELPATSYIRGKSSNASGYAVFGGDDKKRIAVSDVSGRFIEGEQIIINESELYPRTIVDLDRYHMRVANSVHQPTTISGFTIPFLADSVLERETRPETIKIEANTGDVTMVSPGTLTGIRTDMIISYQLPGSTLENFNRLTRVRGFQTRGDLEAVENVAGICTGTLPTVDYTGPFFARPASIKKDDSAFLYAELPNKNVASVNLSESTITFSAQSNRTWVVSSNSVQVGLDDFDIPGDANTARFEVFDEERYSVFYSDGSIENLTPDKVDLVGDGESVLFSNIKNGTISAINATFVKNTVKNKIKQYSRSRIINIDLSSNKQSGTTENTSINDGLTYNQFYGLRVQDKEICLKYPDVVKVIAVYESLDTNTPVVDKITFSPTTNVDTNAIIGENILGSGKAKAVARIVSKPSANTLGIVYLNRGRFDVDQIVTFEESNIEAPIVSITKGKYKNLTNKYNLDKGQKKQYYDYSTIIRKNDEAAPSKKLLVVFDHYIVPASDTGDIFTVNSYDAERFSNDIPNIPKTVANFQEKRNVEVRASDSLDFRPRVSVLTNTNASPFCFASRSFGNEPTIIMSPNESAVIGYDFYLGRIDKLYLNKLGEFTVMQGNPAISPKASNEPSDVMVVAEINLPPYLYSMNDASVRLIDNRRYTMRDIGKIEDRVENLERVTSLSLLEVNTQTLQVQDAKGLNRFKSGFFVDDFKNSDLINNSVSRIEVDTDAGELVPRISRNSLKLVPVGKKIVSDEELDLVSDFALFDENVRKSGDLITLNYKSVGWIEQPFATKVENVNPFHVVSFSGTVKLSPENDTWLRTIRRPDVFLTVTNVVRGSRGRTFRREVVTTATTSVDRVLKTGTEQWMRSRNTGFEAVNLKPTTQHYQFLDSNAGVDFIPKLIEIANDSTLQNYGSVGVFEEGETVDGYFNNRRIMSFRLANSDHKKGPFNRPQFTYSVNPYFPSEKIPTSYNQSSKTLNIDIDSLCAQAQGRYAGYLVIGMRLVGRNSRATAYVKDLRLVTDNCGFLKGSFWLRDPNTTPPPTVRIGTGTKTYKLTSSRTNETPLPGSKLISSAETFYKAEGRYEVRQRTITTTITRTQFFHDPLAQSFSVAGVLEAPNGGKPDEDINGAYVTAVDIYFASKDSASAPLTVEIRTVELGTPTRTVLGNSVTLQPEEIQVSDDASIATNVVFDYPIYLAPNKEYAVVLLAPNSIEYEVWIAEMGERTIETRNLPASEAIRYTTQFALGGLFKSQNGSIWTPNQYQDMKFKLYKAEFTSKTGSAIFSNPTLDESNGYVPTLDEDPIVIYPRQIKVGIVTVTDSSTIGILTTGRKVSAASVPYNYGFIVGAGGSTTSVSVSNRGTNYKTTSNVDTFNLIGGGTGLKLNITANSDGEVTAATISQKGNGYVVGDVVGIVTSSVSSNSGNAAAISINETLSVDTLYLSNVQGDTFSTGSSNLLYYDTNGNTQTVSGVTVIDSTPFGGTVYSGNYFRVAHFEHGMYSENNKVILKDVVSDLPPTTLTVPMTSSTTTVSIASTNNFLTFEGLPVSSVNPGYIQIGQEIIKYTTIGQSNSLGGITRGIKSTIPLDYAVNTEVYKYELGGVSLMRINKMHDVSDFGIDFDSYFLEFDRTNFDSTVTDRSSDQGSSGALQNSPQLCFNNEAAVGEDSVNASQNIIYSRLIPDVPIFAPASVTGASAEFRSIRGTSVSGNEVSFVGSPYEPVDLGVENRLNSVRIVCSDINEQTYLTEFARKKSFVFKVNLSTKDKNVSPAIYWKENSMIFISNRINDPIGNYINDNRVNSLDDDPHSAIYVSNRVNLQNPATSLKVIISAYRHLSADFRVLYSLVRPDSSETRQTFELFPGYKNLTTDGNLDGFPDLVDRAKNSGLPDVFVPESLEDEFREYEFSASNLGPFTGYTIKIVMASKNQAYPLRFRDLRTIALA